MSNISDAKPDLPEKLIRGVVDACADCDSCRFLMDESCLFFPELYRLWDKEKETGIPITRQELLHLVQYCTWCGLCPCPNIREDIIQAKNRLVQKNGMSLSSRLLADIQNLGKASAIFPGWMTLFQKSNLMSICIKKAARIHPHRELPIFQDTPFFQWAKQQRLTHESPAEQKVAYFVGCTGAYLFPQVPQSAVSVLKNNGISVYVPPQQCCGMPTFIEGDSRTSLKRVTFNLSVLLSALQKGYDIVCSCPTCGYFFKKILSEKAYYSDAYQSQAGAKPDEILLPAKDQTLSAKNGFVRLKRSMYKTILKDDGLFSSLNPLDRITLSEHIFDLGEYLARLHKSGKLRMTPLKGQDHRVYYPPCHQREQNIGTPYRTVMEILTGSPIETVGTALDCCGMGGSLGFKESFYEKSLYIGRPLMDKLKNRKPSAILTDCLSCRLQFQHEIGCQVLHPIEAIADSYGASINNLLNSATRCEF